MAQTSPRDWPATLMMLLLGVELVLAAIAFSLAREATLTRQPAPSASGPPPECACRCVVEPRDEPPARPSP